MFNVALALAFVIANFAAPGGRLVSFVFQQEALHTLPPYQQVLSFVFANYWLPALLIYLLMTTVQANRYVLPSRVVHIVLGIANSVLVLYFISRVFTSTVQGGGVTFALDSVAAYPAKVSQWALTGGLTWLVVTSIWRSIKAPGIPAKDLRPLLRTGSFVVALVFLLPPLCFFGWVYVTKSTVIHTAAIARQTREARFEDLCRNVHIDIRRTVTDVKSVFFSSLSELTIPLRKKIDYVEGKNIYGNIVRDIQRKKPLASPPPGEYAEFSREVVPEATADYEISIQSLTDAGDRDLGLGVGQFTVTDRRTNEVLATFTEVTEVSGVKVLRTCPSNFGNYRYELVGYVLGLHDPDKARQIAVQLEKFEAEKFK
ncbi:MAG: hypothetical protein FP821_06615 [Sideroxydans sp.]|nr:hypothetical protein [Sideroxydans sp.]